MFPVDVGRLEHAATEETESHDARLRWLWHCHSRILTGTVGPWDSYSDGGDSNQPRGDTLNLQLSCSIIQINKQERINWKSIGRTSSSRIWGHLEIKAYVWKWIHVHPEDGMSNRGQWWWTTGFWGIWRHTHMSGPFNYCTASFLFWTPVLNPWHQIAVPLWRLSIVAMRIPKLLMELQTNHITSGWCLHCLHDMKCPGFLVFHVLHVTCTQVVSPPFNRVCPEMWYTGPAHEKKSDF